MCEAGQARLHCWLDADPSAGQSDWLCGLNPAGAGTSAPREVSALCLESSTSAMSTSNHDTPASGHCHWPEQIQRCYLCFTKLSRLLQFLASTRLTYDYLLFLSRKIIYALLKLVWCFYCLPCQACRTLLRQCSPDEGSDDCKPAWLAHILHHLLAQQYQETS